MPALLIALAVASIWALNKQSQKNPAIQPTTPSTSTSGVGVTTGFTQPSTSATTQPVSGGMQSNIPSPSGSGVPAWASISSLFAAAPGMPAPGPQQTFYQGTAPAAPLAPAQPVHAGKDRSKKDCGCGCNGQNGANCAGTNKSGSALSPTQSTQVNQPQSQPVLSNASDLTSNSPFDDFTVFQNIIHNAHQQAFSPGGASDHVAPASPWLTPIGWTQSGIYGQ